MVDGCELGRLKLVNFVHTPKLSFLDESLFVDGFSVGGTIVLVDGCEGRFKFFFLTPKFLSLTNGRLLVVFHAASRAIESVVSLLTPEFVCVNEFTVVFLSQR